MYGQANSIQDYRGVCTIPDLSNKPVLRWTNRKLYRLSNLNNQVSVCNRTLGTVILVQPCFQKSI